jgi:pyruvate/2-oxoglutarate dehydrogenase complex dihydrolipoamide dehydrogenase (E3) component
MTEKGNRPPIDIHNQTWIENVHPAGWINPTPAKKYNLVVIGAGPAGLVTAAGAVGLGAKVALVERHLLGGDCLNVGCVPSKSIINAARMAAVLQEAGRFAGAPCPAGAPCTAGVAPLAGVEIDFCAVMERVTSIRAKISHHDSAKRFTELGIDLFFGDASFSGTDRIDVAEKRLRFAKAVIATGARPAEPELPGLKEVGYLTNETVFNLTKRPNSLACIGGGPIGCELSQAFRRLGCELFLFHHHSHLLDREDADASEIVQNTFIREGIQLFLNAKLTRVTKDEMGKTIFFMENGVERSVTVDEILVATGRVPNIEGLNLNSVDVKYDAKKGVWVNDYLQTTNPKIFAAGDICMEWKFTHAADAAARIVLQNALFFKSKKVSDLVIPHCTYTDPEIAHVGIGEKETKGHGQLIDTFIRKLSEVDRAITDGQTDGFVKIHVKKGTDKIVGATIVAKHAGDMISEITLAMIGGVGLGKIAQVIHPYPTQAEGIKQTADAYNRTRLTPFIKTLFSRWLNFKRWF